MTTEQARRVAAVFDLVADTYDAVDVPWFTPIAQRLVAELAPQPGERALDIGCGRGAALWPIAEAVGPSGEVVGFDLAERMVAATRADVEDRGLANVELHVMDAADPQLPDSSFDLVVASLVLFFLPDPFGALRRWRDLLRPGGRIGISSFGERTPEWIAVEEVFRAYLPQPSLNARKAMTNGPFSSDDRVEDLFRETGLTGVRTVGFSMSTTFDDIEHWHRWSRSHGQRAMWEQVPEAEHPTVVARAGELLAPARGADGRIHLTQRVRLTLGNRPER